jgi:TonB-linked SusC/RagA family outer membrane protein
MAGFQQEYDYYTNLLGYNDQLVTDNVAALKTTVGTKNDYTSGTKVHSSTRGYFARLNYNYDEKYILEASYRYDGTSKFKKSDRWVHLPSFSLAYNLAKEDFWKIKEVNSLKIRASYGELGNQKVDNYLYIPTLPIKTNLGYILNGSRPVYAQIAGLLPGSLTWEKLQTKNIGLDISAFKGKLNFESNFFIRTNRDQIGKSEKKPAVLGTTVPKSNDLETETKGFNFTLSYNDKIGDLNYGLSFNLADSKTKVVAFPNPTKLINDYYEGEELGNIWGYETDRIFQKDEEVKDWHDQSKISSRGFKAGDIAYKDLNGDGKIDKGLSTVDDPGDRKVIGNTTPRYQYSFRVNLEWKGFDMSMYWQGIGKRDYWLGGYEFWGATSKWRTVLYKGQTDFWSEDNKGAYFPRPLFDGRNRQVQTRYLQDASYLRLKNLQLGYNVPVSMLNYLKVKKLRVFFSAENLLTITDMIETVDPEAIGKLYPLSRTISVGMNIKF